MSAITFRAPTRADADAIRTIDMAGLATGHASFRAEPHGWEAFSASYLGSQGLARLAIRDGAVAGWGGVVTISDRCVDTGVGEVSLYVAPEAAGQGVGTALLAHLVAETESMGYWTLVASIFPENEASLAIHRRAGFRIVGRRERIGRMNYGPMKGLWRDTLWLERRSAVAGIG